MKDHEEMLNPKEREPDAYDCAASAWIRDGMPPPEWALAGVQDALANQPGLVPPTGGWTLPAATPPVAPWAR